MSQLVQAEITGHAEPVPGVSRIEFYAPGLARAAGPGQFVHIRCGEGSDPLLRRPISIHAVDRQAGTVKIMFQVVGKGTAWLARQKKGLLDVMGPLGRGFTTGQTRRNCVVVGGGIGAAPLYFLLQELAREGCARQVKVLLGARNADRLLIKEETERLGFAVRVATDDGSAGHGGPVTELLSEELQANPGFIYACGPVPMLRAVCGMLESAGVPGEVSVEERMACGVGACLACACRVREAAGGESYRRACVDGPVFAAGEVVW